MEPETLTENQLIMENLEEIRSHISEGLERDQAIVNSIESFENKSRALEEKLDTVVSNLAPLLDLLHSIIKTNISDDTLGRVEPRETKPDLAWRVEDDNIYIYGNKTFDNRELIKSSFKNASWSKMHSAWTFKVFENYADTIAKFFPTILAFPFINDQL